MEFVIAAAYLICLLLIFLFSLGQLHLTWHYLQSLKEDQKQVLQPGVWPLLTVQLPVYNEQYVVERLIDAMAALDYPKDRLEIQLLDDSTDETVDLIASKVAYYQSAGLDMQHIRRPDRKGYKAGALAYGLTLAKGEFIAIFDADFLPETNFLKRTVPHFSSPNIGVVQTRWGHINKDYSLLTRLQAFGLDGHFTIEQGGRSHAGSFINFNGTGGVWRKTCIEDAGGWLDDTLTEDLDLSYRAQMCGWQFTYLENVEVPAELPILMPAIKSQQFRWNKGAAECARKHVGQMFGKHPDRKISWTHRFHALLHLFNSSVFLFLLMAALLSVPMLYITQQDHRYGVLLKLGGIFVIGFFSIGLFYWIANKRVRQKSDQMHTLRHFIIYYPLFLTVMMGMSLHNAVAVAEGLLGFKSPFLRTPKFNVSNAKEKRKNNVYAQYKISFMTVFEMLLAAYFAYGIYTGIRLGDFGMLLFHTMLALGFAAVAFYSVVQTKHG